MLYLINKYHDLQQLMVTPNEASKQAIPMHMLSFCRVVLLQPSNTVILCWSIEYCRKLIQLFHDILSCCFKLYHAKNCYEKSEMHLFKLIYLSVLGISFYLVFPIDWIYMLWFQCVIYFCLSNATNTDHEVSRISFILMM